MTISEIAKLAGVSNAAISRYLNGGSLSAEKRNKIEKIIAETGYKPDTYAQILRTHKIKQIGVIVPKINSNAVAAVTEGISNILSKENYMFLLANTENDTKKELEYLNLFGANRAAGIILLATVITPEHEKIIAKLNIPVVLVGQKHRHFPCVYHNDYDAPRELDELILKRGRRHIAYMGVNEQDEAVGKLRKQALFDVCAEYGIDKSEIIYIEGDFNPDTGRILSKKLIAEHPEIDALVCATDSMAIGSIKSIKEFGKRVPEDVSVVGVGDNWACDIVEPELSTVHYFYTESGEEAGRMILSMIEGKEKLPVRQVMIGYELKIRNSI